LGSFAEVLNAKERMLRGVFRWIATPSFLALDEIGLTDDAEVISPLTQDPALSI
jgi:hypothetical protein